LSQDEPTLRFLGPPSLEGPEGPITGPVNQRLRLAVLARIAGARARGVTREQLSGIFWADAPQANARHALANALYAIRQAIGPDAIVVRGELLTLSPEYVRVDLWEFRDAMDRERLREADAWYRGPLLDGLPAPTAEFERWVDSERAELARLHAAALERLAERDTASGDLAGAAAWHRKLAAQEPLNARIAVQLLRSLAMVGDEAAALQHATAHAELRATELGAGPHPDVEELADEIRRGAWSADPASKTAMAVELSSGVVADVPSAAGVTSLVPSVAVLPFENAGLDESDDYLLDGIADETLHALCLLDDISVAARSSSWAFKGRDVDLREIGRQLGVRAVVEGSVRRVGTRTRVLVRLIDVVQGFQIWSGRYDHDGADLFKIQEEVAADIARNCQARLRMPLIHRHSNDPEAYELYLRGTQALAEATPRAVARAQHRFRAAVDRDPAYAEAHASLSEAYATMVTGISMKDRESVVAKARTSARVALELDDSLARPYLTLGKLAMFCDWDPDHALRLFTTALDRNPNLAAAHIWRVALLSFYRDDPELAERSLAEARRLDPLGVVRQIWEAVYWQNRGEPLRALDVLGRLQDQEPDNPVVSFLLGLYHTMADEPDRAIDHLEHAEQMGDVFPIAIVARAITLVKLDRIQEARALIRSPAFVGRPSLAGCVSYWVGEEDAAFEFLGEAVATHDPTLIYALAGTTFRPLRMDPRLPPVVERMGLDPHVHLRVPAAVASNG
jgi:TolB-like protein